MLGLIVTWSGVGLVAGAVAPFLVPGRRHMPVVVTMVLGVLGSFAGGFLAYLFLGMRADQPGWVVGSIAGAVVTLLLFIAFGRRPTARVPSSSRRRRGKSTPVDNSPTT